jgi:two-component system, sensor histidine kinase
MNSNRKETVTTSLATNAGEQEETPKQQAERDLLTQSGLGGVFFSVCAVIILLVEPLIWTRRWIALSFVVPLLGMMLVRLKIYLGLKNQTHFTLPMLYRCCLLGNAAIWGLFGAWILSLPSALNSSSVLVISTTAAAASGGAISMMMDLKLSRRLVLLYFVPMTLWNLWHLTALDYLAVGLLMVVFIVYLYNLTGKQHRAYWLMLEATRQLRQQARDLAETRNEALAANASLQQARNEAEAAGNAKTEFLAHISHEIRTPLNGVIGMADVLAATELSTEQNEQVGTILESGKLVLGLINDVLNFSQINSGEIHLVEDSVNLKRMVAGLFQMLEPITKARANQLVFTDELHGGYWVKTDRLRLQQLMVNLLSNANKFTENGRIELKLAQFRLAQAELTMLRCEVNDNGVGIEPAFKERIFDPFFQVKENAAYGRGTGLGLAICQRLVHKMDGRIGVESWVGKGSSFWFEIPFIASEMKGEEMTKEAAEEAQADAAVSASPKPAQPVLVVEDNMINRKVIAAFLTKLNFPHVIAETGAEALVSFEQHNPSLILMDCNLPDISGMEVTRQIRQIEKQQDLKPAVVIAVTAHAFANVMQECIESGMNDHMAKPVTLRTLQSMLEKWC